jgi:4-alpha-glucanotransferase
MEFGVVSRESRALEGPLAELARLHGVLLSYEDVHGRRHHASPEAVLATLRALGVAVERPEEAREALFREREARSARCAPSVAVCWDGDPATVELTASSASRRVAWRLDLDTGEVRSGATDVAAGSPLALPRTLPLGMHRLHVECDGRVGETLLLCAPRVSFPRADRTPARHWGLFAPLHAVRSAGSWGIGDYGDLSAIVRFAAKRGATVVGTLPLLPRFLADPRDTALAETSPYRPVSRLLWDEVHVDLQGLPEIDTVHDAAQEAALHRDLERLRRADLVDLAGAFAVKRRVFAALARRLGERGGHRLEAFHRHLQERPHVLAYARFRAACERFGTSWRTWPQRMRDGDVGGDDVPQDAVRAYAYAQWVADDQMRAAADAARNAGPGLYLDLPLGVHPDGFDAWTEPQLFVTGASVGAPPDAVFTGGQDWGIPPLHPERSRTSGHRHFAAILAHHLSCAGILRFDHVMGLHRQFWIPPGAGPEHGVYVRYPAGELLAMLSLASHRHGAWVVGENLGTVPPEVNEAMERHGLHRMFVVEYEMAGGEAPREPATRSVASVGTHDMPPFAAWWEGRDLTALRERGLHDAGQTAGMVAARERARIALLRRLREDGRLSAAAERAGPAASEDAGAVLRALLEHLAEGSAELVLVNVEDLWLEREPQNEPGTGAERPNWRRRARHPLEEWERIEGVGAMLEAVDRARRGAR